MRLFVAAELPRALHDALAQTSALLRDAVHGRFVGTDLFHVTLAFLGEVPAAQADDVCAAVREACWGSAAFTTSLGALGNFGRARDAVLWQGFATGGDSWQSLAADVRANLAQAGLAFDRQGFIPHVTLMRRADLSAGNLPMPVVAAGTIDTVTVFSSDLSGARPRYEAVERMTLVQDSWR